MRGIHHSVVGLAFRANAIHARTAAAGETISRAQQFAVRCFWLDKLFDSSITTKREKEQLRYNFSPLVCQCRKGTLCCVCVLGYSQSWV